MSSELKKQARRVFMEVADLPEGERAGALDGACGGHAELRAEVESLLRADAAAGGFLAEPTNAMPSSPVPTVAALPREQEGQVVGRYKLLQPVGEGGFGTVWMAEQREPVKRRVAFKIIKLGMDTRQVIARFEAERQALALMDHPNIAKVLDAGATETGRPYFVMEYIKGVPILEYCDKEKLDTRARLSLFTQVCQAIQHAHQKGIIHRDIKPGNVLVTMHDGVPVPKVIDFGIAKATSGELTQKTLFTEHRQLIGTPAYMSPEQAEMSGLDIDTRSDIYSLGVLLYELLTGTTPFETGDLMSKGYAEMMRIIREVEPARPSTRLGSLGDTATRTAEQRRAPDPVRLSLMIRGDLDWIVMKCLEKDRTRRYDTASGLAADIQRHLSDEPVTAGPPTAVYRAKKFVRRHRGRVIAGVVVLAVLVTGIIGTTVGLVWALREKEAADRARAESVAAASAEKEAREQAGKRLAQVEKANGVLGSVFRGIDPREVAESGRPLQAVLVEHLDRAVQGLDGEAVGDPLVVAGLQMDLGNSLAGLGEARKAVALLERARVTYAEKVGEDSTEAMTATNDLAMAYFDAGDVQKAQELMEGVLPRRRAKSGESDVETITCMNNLATIYEHQGLHDRSIPLLKDALRLRKEVDGTDHPETANAMHNLALAYMGAEDVDRALPLVRSALRIRKATIGEDHPYTLLSMKLLGDCDAALEDTEGATQQYERAYRRARATLGADHPTTISLATALGKQYYKSGRVDDLTALMESTLPAMRSRLGPEHPDTLNAIGNLAGAYWMQKRLDASVPLYEELVRLSEKVLGPSHPETARARANLGVNYVGAGRYQDALPLLESASAASKEHPELAFVSHALLESYIRTRAPEKAARVLPDVLSYIRGAAPPESVRLAGGLMQIAGLLLDGGLAAEAEPLLREAMVIREKEQPDEWGTFNSRAVLGAALLALGRPDEAEPMMKDGATGLIARLQRVPDAARSRVTEAVDRLVEFYAKDPARGEDLRRWQAERAKLP